MNERINELRLNAGISAALHPYMVAVNKEGEIIDPLKGLQKFAELIVGECIKLSNQSLSKYELPGDKIAEHFGVES